jgi:type I restriction enzyme, R subunit
MPHEDAMRIKDDVAFFLAVKARLAKFEGTATTKSGTHFETAIKQIVDQAFTSDNVIDIFDAAGIKKPDISILSEEFSFPRNVTSIATSAGRNIANCKR